MGGAVGPAGRREPSARAQAEERARTQSSPAPGAAPKPALTAILERESDRARSAPPASLPAEALPLDGPPSGAPRLRTPERPRPLEAGCVAGLRGRCTSCMSREDAANEAPGCAGVRRAEAALCARTGAALN